MTKHKFTDEQIIEALEVRMPHDAICSEAYDLINRQRAEIEAWETGQKALQKNLSQIIRAEAIKEFAERVKEIKVKYALPLLGLQTKTEIESYVDDILLQMRDGIDRLVKEMTEGKQ